MRPSFALAACLVSVVTAHGQIKQFVVDGNSYPAFDPSLDYDEQWNAKRVEWGFAKGKGGVGPVENVASPDITCRYRPLKAPGIEAEARAGSTMSFQWLDWFQSHKGPVLTVGVHIYLRTLLTV
jgi:cellulase